MEAPATEEFEPPTGWQSEHTPTGITYKSQADASGKSNHRIGLHYCRWGLRSYPVQALKVAIADLMGSHDPHPMRQRYYNHSQQDVHIVGRRVSTRGITDVKTIEFRRLNCSGGKYL